MTPDKVTRVLHGVNDPELGINIVDLGLVYSVAVDDDAISVDMTMTTPACPMSAHLVDEATTILRDHFPHARAVSVNLVWEPAWHPERMTETARRFLGWT